MILQKMQLASVFAAILKRMRVGAKAKMVGRGFLGSEAVSKLLDKSLSEVVDG